MKAKSFPIVSINLLPEFRGTQFDIGPVIQTRQGHFHSRSAASRNMYKSEAVSVVDDRHDGGLQLAGTLTWVRLKRQSHISQSCQIGSAANPGFRGQIRPLWRCRIGCARSRIERAVGFPGAAQWCRRSFPAPRSKGQGSAPGLRRCTPKTRQGDVAPLDLSPKAEPLESIHLVGLRRGAG